jgi:PKD repeat protein
MIDLNPSRKPAARTRSGNLLALLLPAALIPALLMLVLAGGATASAQVVTNSADSGPGTLRSAITNAASGAVITFDPSLSGATITLSNTLTMNTNLTIDASALPGGLQINGNGSVQIFNVASNTFVFLNSLTITNGYSTISGRGIYNGGTLTLTNCTLSGNSALNDGGGIFNGGTLALNQCTLSRNYANLGGGIYNYQGLLTLNQCTLSGNSAYNYYVNYYDSIGSGGGIYNYEGTVALTNTIVGGNSGSLGADIFTYATLTYGGSNLVQSVDNSGGTITGPAPLTNAPDLAPLGNYGGPTQTMPPLPGSPAIGAGSVAANIFSTDQSGYPRTEDGLIDLGAMELPIMPPFTASPTGGTPPFSVQFNSTNFDINGGAITGWNWSFGDGTTGTGQNPSHVYSAAGIFSPILIMTNSLGWQLAASGPAITGSSTLLVTNNANSGPGTLRSALTNAANGAVITFAPNLSGATITLSNTLTINTNLTILTIDASALPGGLHINGNDAVTVFNVASTITVSLNSLTITGGYSATNSATVYVGGGGIDNYGTLTLTNCTLSGNSATDNGGGIFNGGTLALNQCTLSGNSGYFGGGIFNHGLLTMNQCTLSGNSAYNAYGGGIFNTGGKVTLNQCTLSGNSAENGGGIYNGFRATLALNQCTLSGNSATDEGGAINNNTGDLAMTNTIVAGNNGGSGADIAFISGFLTYGGANLVQVIDFYSGGVVFGPAPNLAPLGNYGGPMQTMPPLPGSPAIGAGSVAANTFSTDQRGYPRTQNGLIDLGAVELQSPAANPPVLENITVPAGGGANGLQFTFTNAPAADFTVLTATNVSLALTNWTVLGEVQQVAPGQYQFTDPQAATNTGRFYRVRSP